MSFFLKPNREQLRFQPLDLESLIPEDHPVNSSGKCVKN